MKNDKNVTIYFLTQNNHKFSEASETLKDYPNVILKQLAEEKHENKDDSVHDPMRNIAVTAAILAAEKYGKAVVAEDSGIFFEAFSDFPGMNTKWLMKRIGYSGIFRLLDGVSHSAYFRAVLALAFPDGKTEVFEGIVKGKITDKVYGEEVNCMDYDRIFIPEGSDVTFSLIMGDKLSMSHRCLAFKKLGEYFQNITE